MPSTLRPDPSVVGVTTSTPNSSGAYRAKYGRHGSLVRSMSSDTVGETPSSGNPPFLKGHPRKGTMLYGRATPGSKTGPEGDGCWTSVVTTRIYARPLTSANYRSAARPAELAGHMLHRDTDKRRETRQRRHPPREGPRHE